MRKSFQNLRVSTVDNERHEKMGNHFWNTLHCRMNLYSIPLIQVPSKCHDKTDISHANTVTWCLVRFHTTREIARTLKQVRKYQMRVNLGTLKFNIMSKYMKDELVESGQGDSRDSEQHVRKMSIFIRLGTSMNMYKTVYKLSRPLETSFIKQVHS